jgi:hypothetical protein
MKKICSKCNEEKEFKDYNRRDGTKDGYLSYCRACYSKKGRFYHQRDKQKKEALKKDIRYVQD